MRFLSAISFFILFSAIAHGQCILTVRGTVKDADTRSALVGATVSIIELKKTILTDNEGKYVLSGICPGDYTLRITHADCQALDFHFHLKEDLIKTFQLSHAENLLKEVVVVGAATVRPEGMTGELKGKELAATRGLSLGESLQRITGVTVLQTGNNIYKPVIQGLHSSRVLILNNGIRQEGQQWGSEHAPEVDPFVSKNIQVIKGPAGLRYGGDAIGGLILMEPNSLPDTSGILGEAQTIFFTNGRQFVTSGMLEGGFKNVNGWGWRVQARPGRRIP